MKTEALGRWLENILHTKIPLTKEMDIRVTGYDGATLKLRAPLARNVNDKGSAFGGSLFSLAVLAGWGLLSLKLKEENLAGDVVIHETSVTYRHPVSEDLEACCELAGDNEYSKLITALRTRGKGRITLDVNVMQGSRIAMHFRGSFVAFRLNR